MTLGDMLKKVTHLGHKNHAPEEQVPSGSAGVGSGIAGAGPVPADGLNIPDASTPAGAVGETRGDRHLENAIKVGEPGLLPGTETKVAEPFPLPGMAFGGHRASNI